MTVPDAPIDPRDPDTLYAEGPVAAEPPDDDVSDSSPLRDSGDRAGAGRPELSSHDRPAEVVPPPPRGCA